MAFTKLAPVLRYIQWICKRNETVQLHPRNGFHEACSCIYSKYVNGSCVTLDMSSKSMQAAAPKHKATNSTMMPTVMPLAELSNVCKATSMPLQNKRWLPSGEVVWTTCLCRDSVCIGEHVSTQLIGGFHQVRWCGLHVYVGRVSVLENKSVHS